MKRLFILMLGFLLCMSCTENHDPLANVNPFIGTGFHGHTYPGATTPYGMVQLSPDTRLSGWDACSGYHYDDNTIYGFSHTHLSGTGCADLTDVLFHPSCSMEDFDEQLNYQPYTFSHTDEKASCGFYEVSLPKNKLKVSLTATPRCGVHRYEFRGDEHLLLIDLKHSTSDEELEMSRFIPMTDTELQGMRRTKGWVNDHFVFFSAEFSTPYEIVKIVDDEKALLRFAPDVKTLTIAVGLSGVCGDNAHLNRETEVEVLDFDKTLKETEALWREAMSDIQVEGGDKASLVNFYTAQYHTKLAPNLMSDVNGEFRRNNGEISKVAEGRKYYSTLSLWDTFRAWNPLQTLVNKTLVADMVWSMMDMYDATGELPIWPLASGETGCMIGYHSVSVIADAYLNGIVPCNEKKMLEAMIHSSNINKKGSDLVNKYGYIPANVRNESISCLLEFSYDDWAIARMAEKMGREDVAKEYYERSKNYANVFDGSTCFFRGHNVDGSWTTPFEEFATGRDYTEATPWQYRFFVPHDILGLEALFGGREAFTHELDRLFTLENKDMQLDVSDVTGLKGQYAHGNEPSHHMAYLYNWVGQPWKTQEITRALLEEMYQPTPEGIIGNEDCGQMSAWYVMSALGMYPVCPASGDFSLTTPLFKKAILRLANGKELVIEANHPKRNPYIESLELNGKEVNRTYIKYDELMEGGLLNFDLGLKPNPEFAQGDESMAYSLSDGKAVSVPYTTQSLSLFEKPVQVKLYSTTEGAKIYYTLNGEEPTEQSTLYEYPIEVNSHLTLKARAYKEGLRPSLTFKIEAQPAVYRRPVTHVASRQGCRYAYYEGLCSKVSDIEKGRKVQTGVLTKPSIKDALLKDHFAYIFEGLVDVPETGVWEFMTKSDDGCVLFIDGEEVVSNDLSHAAIAATGRIALQKGLHSYKLLYFEDYEGEHLEWGWRMNPDEDFKDIDEKYLKLR